MGLIKNAIKQVLVNWIYSKDNGGFFYNQNAVIGQRGAVWLDTTIPYKLYESIPQLRAVITRKASMFSNMELYVIDIKSQKRLENKELDKLLQNPNAAQSQNEFLRQFKEQEQVYGNQFIYKNQPSALMAVPIALWNISPALIVPELSGKMFEQTDISEIITHYTYRLGNITRTFETNEILFSRICDLDNPIIGKSPVRSLKYPISNIEAAYEYRNVIMKEKGAIGILSNQSKDAMGAMPLRSEERKKIDEGFVNRYGIGKGQSRVILTDASLSWTPMSYPTKEMMLFEEVDSNFLTIVDHFGLNINMFSNKQSTFENVKQSIIQAYQDTIIPEADQFTQALSKFLKLQEGTRIVASYEHVSILKDNKVKGMESIKIIVEALRGAVEGGILDKQTAIAILQTELGLS